MGVDIHMNIIDKDGKCVKREIFDGRNSYWFSNLQGYAQDSEYEELPIEIGVPSNVDETIKRDYNDSDFYNFYYVDCDKFLNWFEKYRPDVNAGWVTKKEAWLYKRKHIIPMLTSYLSEDFNPIDAEFIEVENKNDCSKWLRNYLIDNNFTSNEYKIVYYFDC